MSSVTELVELLKQGAISKEELLTRMRSPDVTISSSFASNPRLPEDLQWSLPISPRQATPMDEEERPLEAPHMSAASLPPAVSLRSSVSYSRLSPEQFYAYQTNWKRSRQEAADQLKEQLQAAEVKDCTFHPKTNPSSQAVSPAFDRLYQVRDPRYFELIRRQFRAREEEVALRECSFQPRINTRSHSVASKHKDTNKEVKINPRTLQDIEKECTFVPKVNQLKRGMKAAQEYVASDPFERLTRVKPKEAPLELAEGSLVASALASSKDQRPVETSDDLTTFSQKSFFERQALFEIMKTEKKLQLAQQSVSQQPVILERSKQMVTETFEERNNKLLEKRHKQISLQEYDSECTFAPTISRKAQEKRKRTMEELSYGDAEKREQRLANLKDALDQRALSAKVPQMSTSIVSTSSHLQLSSGLETYLARVQQDKDRKAAAVEKIRMERQSREMRDCTYAPITKDAPSYIKRMARSVAMLKAELPPAAPPDKPEWR